MKYMKFSKLRLLFSALLMLSVYSSNAFCESDVISEGVNNNGVQLNKNDASVVIYRAGNSQLKNGKPITVYVNEHVAGVLLSNTYMLVSTCVGAVDLGFSISGGAKLKIQPPISVREGKTAYIKLVEAGNAQLLVQGVDAEIAENEVRSITEVSQVINRYVPDCSLSQAVLHQTSLGADALFSFNSSEISPTGFAQLDSFISDLKGQINRVSGLRVVGHTDFLGDSRYNESLSLARAKSVAEYFKGHGLNLPMSTEGRGESEPVSNGCERLKNERSSMIACLQRDRRVVIEVMGK